MKGRMTLGLREELKGEIERRQQAENDKKLAKEEVVKLTEETAKRETIRVGRIFDTARKWSRRVRNSIEVIALVVLVLAVILTFPWGFQMGTLPLIIRSIVVFAFLALFILTLVGLKSGASLDSLLSRFEDRTTKWIANKLDIK
jgi:hypothetical protein